MYRRNKGKDEVSRTKRKKILCFGVITVFLLFYILISPILGDLGLKNFIMLRDRSASLKLELGTLESKNMMLKERIMLMKAGDPFEMEKIARERLDLVKKGDIVYKILE